MDYALAKQLKDAGFPQPPLTGLEFNGIEGEEPYCYHPTLSELIEACGERFIALVKYPKPNMFRADGGSIDAIVYEQGATPEEAVAKLWLALQE